MLLHHLLETTRSYQEEPTSVFTHDGRRYDLNRLLNATSKQSIMRLRCDDLKWVLYGETLDPSRVKRADISVPVLATKWNDRWVVLDGVHRLTKAIQDGEEYLPARVVSAAQLEKAEI